LDDANRVARDKRVVVYEIEMLIDRTLMDGPLGLDIQAKMNGHSIKTTPVPMPIPYTVLWKRHVAKRWDPTIQAFSPLPTAHEYEERFVMYVPPVSEIVKWVSENQLVQKLSELKHAYRGKHLVLLLHGLEEYYRKTKNAQNKIVRSKILRELGEEETTRSRGKKKSVKPVEENMVSVDRDKIDQVMLQLQCELDCFVLQTTKQENIAEWLAVYSREVAVAPYEYVQYDRTCVILEIH
jgi:hypothetical protein